MSIISNYLKMNTSDIEKEISRQMKKITAAKETIALLKRLQVAAAGNVQHRSPVNPPEGGINNGQH